MCSSDLPPTLGGPPTPPVSDIPGSSAQRNVDPLLPPTTGAADPQTPISDPGIRNKNAPLPIPDISPTPPTSDEPDPFASPRDPTAVVDDADAEIEARREASRAKEKRRFLKNIILAVVGLLFLIVLATIMMLI